MAIKIQATGNYMYVAHTTNGEQITNEQYFPKLYSYIFKNYETPAFDLARFDNDRDAITIENNLQLAKINTQFNEERTELTNNIVNSRSYKERQATLEKLNQVTEKHNEEILNVEQQYNDAIKKIDEEQSEALLEHLPKLTHLNLVNSLGNEVLSMSVQDLESGLVTDVKGGTIYTMETLVEMLVQLTSGEVSVMPPFEREIGEDFALPVKMIVSA